MADFAVPGTWTFDGSANANQSQYRVSGHTAMEPYVVQFSRKPLTSNNGVFSKPAVRVRIYRGYLDAAGKPMAQKCDADINISWPAGSDATKNKAVVTLIGTIFADVNLASDLIDDLDIPLQ